MDCKIYTKEEYSLSNWSGGTTSQLAIYPESSNYIERNFIWRISSATVALEESDFTKLPDYQRALMVLSGQVVLSYNDEKTVKLSTLESDNFDGAWKTKSFGKIVDYNLMVRKGGTGHLKVCKPVEERQEIELPDCHGYNRLTKGFYCHEGYAIVTVEGGDKPSYMLKSGEQLIVNIKVDNEPAGKIGIMGEGVTVCSTILYNEVNLGPEIIPKEKATPEDFIEAAKMSMTNFRGSRYLFKKLQTIWYDEALKNAVDKLEKPFIPFIICMLGLTAAAYYGNKLYGASGAMLAIFAWVIVDFVVITPFMYFMVLPKPIKKHIKKLDSLTEYEQKVYERELNNNDQAERILKKYKISGRNVYIEDKKK